MNELINQSINYEGVCRTAPATPGLLKSNCKGIIYFPVREWESNGRGAVLNSTQMYSSVCVGGGRQGGGSQEEGLIGTGGEE